MPTYGAVSGHGCKVVGSDDAIVHKGNSRAFRRAAQQAASRAPKSKEVALRSKGAAVHVPYTPRWEQAGPGVPNPRPKRSNTARNVALAATGTAAVGGGAYAFKRKETASKGMARQSVMPTLARVRPNRSMRRTVTGDQVNARRIIGKSLTPEQNRAAKANAARRGVKRGAYDNLRAAGKPMAMAKSDLLLVEVEKFSMPSMSGLKNVWGKTKQAGSSGLFGLKQGWKGTSGVVGGAQTASTRTYDAARTVGSTARKRPGLAIAGGLGAAGGAGVLAGTSFGKRRFDPEDARRHRQGQLSGLAAAGGIGALGNAGRLARNDSKAFSNSRVSPKSADEFAPKYAVPSRKAKEPDFDYAHRMDRAMSEHKAKTGRHKQLSASLKSAEKLKGRKLIAVGGRSGMYGGAGIALIGTAGALHRGRREERYD